MMKPNKLHFSFILFNRCNLIALMIAPKSQLGEEEEAEKKTLNICSTRMCDKANLCEAKEDFLWVKQSLGRLRFTNHKETKVPYHIDEMKKKISENDYKSRVGVLHHTIQSVSIPSNLMNRIFVLFENAMNEFVKIAQNNPKNIPNNNKKTKIICYCTLGI